MIRLKWNALLQLFELQKYFIVVETEYFNYLKYNIPNVQFYSHHIHNIYIFSKNVEQCLPPHQKSREDCNSVSYLCLKSNMHTGNLKFHEHFNRLSHVVLIIWMYRVLDTTRYFKMKCLVDKRNGDNWNFLAHWSQNLILHNCLELYNY